MFLTLNSYLIALPLVPHQSVELIEINREVTCFIIADRTGMDELHELLVHALHAKLSSGLNNCIELMGFTFANDIPHGRCSDEYLDRKSVV